ncbi:outer membrane lipoprotein LolB [Cupriavidus oxalaticus]|jgi:outer membrane lipoprotein LolB|uniref:Outer-membrane lipoprotein LolB n=1 Tax=Cupriavidus oxalaticus TaxID=96344 RepID=A0A976BCH3_9BURK|nr:outer membrane lipoprotein LolB [Cupriavidus oxalaticus]QRQ87090.1 lipoprotein localization protein LolB [Cupriavidus oxalaticus]QRQ94582.1 lipoprotein localization protein LolB [Cupriavidus oxalaticus]WQD83228.1 outer membrane lipoprotein LolB [Cupriavidus oxalaticus]SPC14058.1 Outer-membrane lipoprotein LolB [Cupriavidus oxalaticus]
MNRTRRLALLCLGAPLLLQACATVAPSRDFDAGESSASRQYTGRFSANYQRYGRDEGVTGSFRWEEQGRNVRLDLVSPLGQTLAVVTATPSGATLDLPNQPPRNAPEVDTLMEEALGFALPVAGMRDWLHGRAAQGSPASTTRDEQGRLSTLAQNGWTVRYVAWQDTQPPTTATTATTTAALPRRIDLARDSGSNPLSVRLVIDPRTP